MTAEHDQPTPAERRLAEHLELLRSQPPQPPMALVPRVVHTARWQRAVRQPLVVLAGVAAAVADGIRILFGSRTGRS